MFRYLIVFVAVWLLVTPVITVSKTGDCEDKKQSSVRFTRPSMFGDVLVVDSMSQRHLRFGSICGADQSSISLIEPDHIVMEYVRNASLSLSFSGELDNALIVGMGGGVFSNLLANNILDIEIDAIEINPVVVEAAKAYFGVTETKKYKIHIQDAADYIESNKQHYDIILLDAYSGDGIPNHLTTKSFFKKVADRLNPGGVVVANFGLSSPRLYLQLADRLREAVGSTRCLHGKEESNLVVIATKAEMITNAEVVTRSKQLDRELRLPFSLANIASSLKVCPRL